MSRLGMWIAAVAVMAGVGVWSSGLVTTARVEAAPSAPSGKALFSKYCAGCHGAKGNMPSGFQSKVKGMTEDQVESLVKNGKGGMPAFGKKLSAAQIDAVSRYVKSLAGGSDPAAAGKAIYTKNCAGCHGANGTTVSGWKKAVKSMSEGQVESVVTNGKGAMPAFGKKLSAAQIEAVSHYAKSLASH